MSGHEPAEEGYRFDGFHLLPGRRHLLRDGTKIALSPRALSILIVLIERRERVVPKNEILDEAFPGVFVEEQNVAVHMSALRQVLGPMAITTIPGRGYRFTAKLERELPRAPEPPAAPAPEPQAPASTNLPRRPALIGRAIELAELPGIVAANRLVTLAGPGGIGKTGLAVELGWKLRGEFPDGVWLIDLAPLTEAGLIASAAATVLGVALRDSQKPAEVIAAAIARKRLLLIFDNCEYLVAGAAEFIAALLDRVAGLSVLVTSQEILGLAAEVIYRLDPLALPPVAFKGGADEMARFGAVELFVARARAADRRFALDAGNAAGVAAICRGLEGVPLALEMAACRLPLLGVEGVRARLGERLKILAGRTRTGESRHRTLRAMVEWSHGLLDPVDQRVFRRLAVFRGSFSLEAVIAVAGEEGAEPFDTVDALGRLIDKSLATVEGSDEPRYRLLETLRLYAAEKLALSTDSKKVSQLHLLHFTRLFGQAYEVWETTPDAEWQEIYCADIDNVRVAMDWALSDPGRSQSAIELAAVGARIGMC